MNVMQMDAAQGDTAALGAGSHAGEYRYQADSLPGSNDMSGAFSQGRPDNGLLLQDGGDSTSVGGMPLPTDFGDFPRPPGDVASHDMQHMYYNAGFDQAGPRSIYGGMAKAARPVMQHQTSGYGAAMQRFPMASGSSIAAQHGGSTPTLNQLLTQGQKYPGGHGGSSNFMDCTAGNAKSANFEGGQPWGMLHPGMYPPTAFQQQQHAKQIPPGMMGDVRRTNGMPPPSYGQLPGSQQQYGGAGGAGPMPFMPPTPSSLQRRPMMSGGQGHPYGSPSQGVSHQVQYGSQQVPAGQQQQLTYMQQREQQERMDEAMNSDVPGSFLVRALPSPISSSSSSSGGSHHPSSRGMAQAPSPSCAPAGGMLPVPRHHSSTADVMSTQQMQMHGHMMPPPMMMSMSSMTGGARMSSGSPAPPLGIMPSGFGPGMGSPFAQPSYRPGGQPYPQQQLLPNAGNAGYPNPYQLDQQQQSGGTMFGMRGGPVAGASFMKSPSHADVMEKKLRKEGASRVGGGGSGGSGGSLHPPTPVTPSPGGNNSIASAGMDEVEDISSPSWPGTPNPRSVGSGGGGSGSASSSSECLAKIYEMGDEPERRPFLDRLGALMDEKGMPVNAMPQMSKQPLDLFRFYLTVKEKGGFEQVSKRKLWKEIGNSIHIGASTYAAFTLKKAYLKYLLLYECRYDRNGLDPQTIINAMEVKAANAKKNSLKKKQAQAAAAAASAAGGGPPLASSPSGSSSQCGETAMQFRQQALPMLDCTPGGAPSKSGASFPLVRDHAPSGVGGGCQPSMHHPGPADLYPPLTAGMAAGLYAPESGLPSDVTAMSNGPRYPSPQYFMARHQGIPNASSGSTSDGGFGAGRHRATGGGLGRLQPTADSDLSQQDVDQSVAAMSIQPTDGGAETNGYGGHVGAGGQDEWQQRTMPLPSGGYYVQQGAPHQPGFGLPPLPHHQGSAMHGMGAIFRQSSTGGTLPLPFQQQQQRFQMNQQTPSSVSGTQASQQRSGQPGQAYNGSSSGYGMNFAHRQLSSDGTSGPVSAVISGSGDAWPVPSGSGYVGRLPASATPPSHPWAPPVSSGGENTASSGALAGGLAVGNHTVGNHTPTVASSPSASLPTNGWEGQPQVISTSAQSMEQRQAGASPYPMFGSDLTSGPGTDSGAAAAEGTAAIQQPQSQQQLASETSLLPDNVSPKQPWPSPQLTQQPRFAPANNSGSSSASPVSRTNAAMPPPGYTPYSQQQKPHVPQPQLQHSRGSEDGSVRAALQKSVGVRGINGERDFPAGCIEALQWKPTRRKVLYSKDIGAVDPWRVMMALKSGLLCESTWALDVLNVLLHDDSTVVYFNLLHLPGLLDVVLEHYIEALKDMFSEFKCRSPYDDCDMECGDSVDGGPSDAPELPDSSATGFRKRTRCDRGHDCASIRGHCASFRCHVPLMDLTEPGWSDASGVVQQRVAWEAWQTAPLDHVVSCAHQCDCAPLSKKLFYRKPSSYRCTLPDRLCGNASDEAAAANPGREAHEDTAAAANDKGAGAHDCEQRLGDQAQDDREDLQDGKPYGRRSLVPPEPMDSDDTLLAVADEGCESKAAKCLCIANIVRSLSFIPDNEKRMCESSGLIVALGAVLRLGWVPDQRRPRDWRWDCLDALREDSLVTMSNISGQLDLGAYDESVCRPLLEAVLFWATSESAYAREAHSLAACAGTYGAHSQSLPLSPQRLAVECMCKMCVHSGNVDLLLATPPWWRLARLFGELVKMLGDAKEHVLREFAIVLISGFVQSGDSGAARAVALRDPCVSLLLDFIEAAEQTALQVAQNQGVHALRDNPEVMGTSVDMIRRVASVLVTMAQVPENRPLFLKHQSRLLNLVMSQILDQHVSRLLSSVLFECAKL